MSGSEWNSKIPEWMIFERNVKVTMSDGLQLRINVYRPKKEGKYPVVMIHGPYGKDTAMSEAPPFKDYQWSKLLKEVPSIKEKSSTKLIRWEAVDPEVWVAHDYITIHADSRGSGASPGFLELFSDRQVEDYATLITWASKQPWSNSKVGLLGISYYAMNQWQVASRQPEGLAAIIPWEGAIDLYRDAINHGGIFSSFFLESWYFRQVTSIQNGNGNTAYPDSIVEGEKPTGDPLPPHLLAANRAPLHILAAAQPFDSAYYHMMTPDPSRIKVPLLSVGNWGGQGLHLRGNIEGYSNAASKEKWLRVHCGDHIAPFYRPESIDVQMRFFDHYLKGIDNGWEKEPPVNLAIRHPHGKDVWRAEKAWPLPGTDYQEWYLDSSNLHLGLNRPASSAEKSFKALEDGLTFTTQPFEHETEFTGHVKLRLFVKSSTEDTDIFAVLRLQDPDGKEITYEAASDPSTPVAVGWQRVSHRALDEKLSTPYRPYHSHLKAEPMVPGEIYEVEVEIWATSFVVYPGYRVLLTVQGKDWAWPGSPEVIPPGVSAKFGSGPFLHLKRLEQDAYKGVSTIVTGPNHPAFLLLPRIPANRS